MCPTLFAWSLPVKYWKMEFSIYWYLLLTHIRTMIRTIWKVGGWGDTLQLACHGIGFTNILFTKVKHRCKCVVRMNVDLYSTLPLIIHVNLCMFLFIALSLSLSLSPPLSFNRYLLSEDDSWWLVFTGSLSHAIHWALQRTRFWTWCHSKHDLYIYIEAKFCVRIYWSNYPY